MNVDKSQDITPNLEERGDVEGMALAIGMVTAVAAAASVPSSFTPTKALWKTDETKSESSWDGSRPLIAERQRYEAF